MATGFFYGGGVGVLIAAIFVPLLAPTLTFTSALLVGLVEELSKILAVIWVTRDRKHVSELNGIIYGAAVGMGFAALESTGYAFAAFLESQGSLSMTVIFTLIRGFLAPIGHRTWTAIFAGVLFAESRPFRYKLDYQVLGAYLLVSLLHGLWDGMPILLAGVDNTLVVTLLSQVVVAAVGFYVLYRVWQHSKKRQTKEVKEGNE